MNDKLQEQGQVTIAELAKQYDLPGEFLSEVSLAMCEVLTELTLSYLYMCV